MTNYAFQGVGALLNLTSALARARQHILTNVLLFDFQQFRTIPK